ncbi:recombinase RecT, partial [Vibrio cholerae]|uniref:recombinase RecT n=1 Tax=Vibrio cholerae TaxID=666 RepID=UPI0018F06B60|nr:recombinase RecT [Vibrio cholerae]
MEKPKLIQRFAERSGVDPNKLFDTLKATAFRHRDGSAPTNEQMMALLVVADQYGLNPFTKEIFAFP